MSSLDIILLAFKNFLRRKIRTSLTILGVVIGTAAIVVMLSLGIGMNESFKKEVSRMGSLNIINVDPYFVPEGPQSSYRPTKQVKIDDMLVEKIAQIEGVEAVTPVVQASMKLISGKFVAFINITAIRPDVMDKFNFVVSEGQGRILSKDDGNAVVFGFSVPQQFFNPKSRGGYYGGEGQKPPIDVLTAKILGTFDMSYGEKNPMGSSSQSDKKQTKLFKIDGVGILKQSNDEKDYSVYMNLANLKKIVREASKGQVNKGSMYGIVPDLSNGYQQVMVKVKDINDVERVQKQIKAMGLGASSLGDILKSMQKTAQTMQAVLGGIGAISLLVAALGITNTMIMSIYERTREIGIMKVLGCVLTDIKKLFLLESGLIGFMGGIVGIIFSIAASFLMNKFGSSILGAFGTGMPPVPGEEPNKVSIIPLWLMLSSIGFATLVGLSSGYYPARRAMKLSALEAIRTE